MLYQFYPCDAAGKRNEGLLVEAPAAIVPAAIDVMVSLQADFYEVQATGHAYVARVRRNPTGDGWDVFGPENLLENDDPHPTLAAALLDAADVIDEFIDGHADWS